MLRQLGNSFREQSLASSSGLMPCGKYSVQNRQLFFFFVSQFSAAAFFETFDRILALLRLFANDLNGFSVIEFRLRVGFAIAAYFNADLSMRSTPSFVASLARIASFRSESTRCCSVMRHNYDDQTQLSML